MKYFFTVMLCIMSARGVLACDVCGGGLGFQGMGFLSNSNYHFAGLSYKLSTFHTEHPKLFDNESTVLGSNTFETVEAFGRFRVTDRIQILGYIPVHFKNITDTEDTYNLDGLGDITTVFNFLGVKRKKLKWFIGAGVKLPTGASNRLVNDQFIANLQSGTGSLDGLLTTNLTYLKGKLGINTEVNYLATSTGSRDYKFGNQLDAVTLLFYKMVKNKTVILPQIGVSYLQKTRDYSSKSKELRDEYSGINMISLPLGLDVYMKRFAFRTKYSFPLSATLSRGYVTPKINLQTQLIYIINNN